MKSAAIRALLIFVVVLLIVPAGSGCAPGTRYRLLSFFFDGVPRPEGMAAPAKPGAGATTQASAPKAVISKHEPYVKKQCNKCHTPITNTLVAAVPELCFGCHQMGLKMKRYIHAPALAGFCRLCHDPHSSRNAHLLLAEPRKMCFYCHNPEDVAKNTAHADEQAPCTRCHDPHADNRYFLVADVAGTPAAASLPVSGTEAGRTDAGQEVGSQPRMPEPPAPAVTAATGALPPGGGADRGVPPRSADSSLPPSLATLLELWQLDDFAAEVRRWNVFNFQAKLLPRYFDGDDPFRIPGLAFVTSPVTEDALRAWNLPCLVREEGGEQGPRFVVLIVLDGDRGTILDPGGARVDISVSLWMKQLRGELAFLAPVEAIPTALLPGEQGPAVLALQQELQRTGFFREVPNAFYGESTAEAVRDLQGSLGLEQDGMAGRQTRLRLLRLDGRTIPLLRERP